MRPVDSECFSRFGGEETSFFFFTLAVKLDQQNTFRKAIALPSEFREYSLRAANVKLPIAKVNSSVKRP